jgi:2-oxoisovalerate dehydrogenase E2 component (dihydrolipoyl transacylase)
VEEFDELCEVQSDKAAVQITSQYAGIIMKLRHEVGDMVQVTL